MATFGSVSRSPSFGVAWRRPNVARVNLVIARNVPFAQGFQLEHSDAPWDMTGVAVAAQVRAAGRRRQNLLIDFADLVDGLTVTEVEGRVVLSAPLEVTSALPLVPAEWDMVLTPDAGLPFTVMGGDVDIVAGVTE